LTIARPSPAIEHALGLLRGHPDSGVGDDDPYPGAVGFSADMDPAALRRVQVGVGEEVPDYLPELVGVSQRGRQGRRDVDPELLVFASDSCAEQLDGLTDGLADIDRSSIDRGLVGAQPGDVEQFVDKVDEPIGGAADDLDELSLARRDRVGVGATGQQLGEALDRGQRAAQFMRRGRHEIAAGPFGDLHCGQLRPQLGDRLVQPPAFRELTAALRGQCRDHDHRDDGHDNGQCHRRGS
jgi:hypothetical protein